MNGVFGKQKCHGAHVELATKKENLWVQLEYIRTFGTAKKDTSIRDQEEKRLKSNSQAKVTSWKYEKEKKLVLISRIRLVY